MKIRTDFVTNSSSSSYVTINIKGTLFAKLLKKYKGVLESVFSEKNEFLGGKIEIKSGKVNIKEYYIDYIPYEKQIIFVKDSLKKVNNLRKQLSDAERDLQEHILKLV